MGSTSGSQASQSRSFDREIRFQFRGEFFNVLNTTNWNAPGRTLGGSGFGEVTSAADPRIIQLGAKLIW